jgi:hypothetical protein
VSHAELAYLGMVIAGMATFALALAYASFVAGR